mgnify:CR=1 FL=1
MEQAFLLLKDIAGEIAEYQEGMLHGTSPYHSLRLSPARHGPPVKGRKLDTGENRSFLSGFNLGGRAGTGLPTNEIIERLYGGKGKVRNSPLPLLDPVTGQSHSGRFVFPAEAFAFNPNLTQRGHIDNQGNIIDMNALTRANPDVPPWIHNDKLNLYGFEGIDPQRFGDNVQAEGIIYGDVDENKVHQLNDNPLTIAEISRASRLMSPFVNAKKEFDTFKEHDYNRIRRAAEVLMAAQIPPVLFDSQGLDAQDIWSPDDPQLAEPTNATFLHDPFKQWDKGAGLNTEEMHQQVAQGVMSPEQLELLDHELIYASEPMDIAMRLLKLELAPPMTQGVEEETPMQEETPTVDVGMNDFESPCECAERVRSAMLNLILDTEKRFGHDLSKAYQDWQGYSCQEILQYLEDSRNSEAIKNQLGIVCDNSGISEADQMKYTGEPMDIAMRLLKNETQLHQDFEELHQTAFDGNKSGWDGKERWNEMKAGINEKYGDESIPGATWKQPFDLEGFDPNDMSQDYHENGKATPLHFLNQLKRIPMQNKPTAKKILQMALNSGQGHAENVIEKPYSLSDFVDFNNIQTSEPMDIAMRLLKEDKTPDFSDEPVNQCEMCNKYLDDSDYHVLNDYNYCSDCYNQLAEPEDFDPDFQNVMTGEPMDIAMQLLKERVSPEAKRHKLEYDKKYESNPVRVKYREDLNRERRRRHIMGQGGPDMSHTSQHTIVPEDPHTNRARHFKDKGTLL